MSNIFVAAPRNKGSFNRSTELPEVTDLGDCARFSGSELRDLHNVFGDFTLVATHHNGLVLEIELPYMI